MDAQAKVKSEKQSVYGRTSSAFILSIFKNAIKSYFFV